MSIDIWLEAKQLERDRMVFMEEAMKDYDANIYRPAMNAVRERCLSTYGKHADTRYHNNGIGGEFYFCGRCGARHSISSDSNSTTAQSGES